MTTVGVAFEDQLVGRVEQAVYGALCQQRVGHDRQPLLGLAIGDHDHGGAAMTLDDNLVEILGLLVVVGLVGKVVEDEQVNVEQASQLLVITGVQPSGLKSLEQALAAEHEH